MTKKKARFGAVTIPTDTYKDVREYVYDAANALGQAVEVAGDPETCLAEILRRSAFAHVHAGSCGAHDGVVVHPGLARALSVLGITHTAAGVRIPRD